MTRDDVKKQYLSEIKSALPDIEAHGKLLDSVTGSVDAYLDAHFAATAEELYQAIGSPEEVAQAALDETPAVEIQKKLVRKKKWAVLAIVALLVLALIGAEVAYIANSLHEISEGTFVNEVGEGSQVEIPSNLDGEH